MPPKQKILFYDKEKSDQFWQRMPVPEWYLEKEKEEEYRREEELRMVELGRLQKVSYVDAACEKYRRTEWLRRMHGVYFMNDGEPTYITGHHYFYLQWTKWDHQENDGYPIYYEHSRDSFYYRAYCEADPLSLGYMIIGPRGTGKTNEELACVINNVTSKHFHRAALQSKSYEKDAQEVLFQTKTVNVINNLPRFFKPVSSSGSNPKESLNFERQAVRGKKAKDVEYGPDFELNSSITAVKPGEKVLDSDTLGEILEDEIGKTDPATVADIYVRHSVNLKVVFRNHRKVGLLRKTSTVEEMDKGGAECAKLWKESDPRIRDKNGQTASKIYRYFISALRTDTSHAACDKHGRVDREIAYQRIMNERELYKNDLQKLSQEMRKNPINEEEAFITDQSKSLFNVFIITQRLSQLYQRDKPLYTRGNFYWINGDIGPVDFEVDWHSGRWHVNKLLDTKDKDRGMGIYANAWMATPGSSVKAHYKPLHSNFFRFGGDPIKYSKTKDPRASKAAYHGFEMYNPLFDNGVPVEQWRTYNYFLEYENRPEEPEQSYEDAIMQCFYYGAPILLESNLKEVVKHFRDRGCGDFLIHRRDFDVDMISGSQDDDGLSSNPEVIDTYIKRIIPFINKHGMRMPFDRTIESWKAFDAKDTTSHHLTVSSGYALMACEAVMDEKTTEIELADWFDGYYYHESNE